MSGSYPGQQQVFSAAISTATDDQQRSAVRGVLRHARDPADAALLLDALGLLGTAHDMARKEAA